MTTLSLDHIQIAVPVNSEAECRAFWGKLLELSEIEKPATLKSRGGCWFALQGCALHLGVEDPFSPAKKAHPGFRVQAIAALAERLLAANYLVKWDDSIKERQRFFSEDPFGNRLEFLQDN